MTDEAEAGLSALRIGTDFISKGEFSNAVSVLVSARALFENGGYDTSLAKWNWALGTALLQGGQHVEAETAYLAARNYYEAANLPEDVAACNANLGIVYRLMGKYAQAETAHLSARTYFEAESLSKEIAGCDQNLGNVYQATGKYAQAETAYSSARTYFEKANLSGNVADCDVNLGVLYRLTGRYTQAEIANLAARTYFDAAGRPDKVAACDQNLGVVYELTGRFPQAEVAYLGARTYYEAARLPEDVATCDANLGVVYKLTGRYAQAETVYLAARAYFEAANLPEYVATCDRNLAGLLWQRAGESVDEARREDLLRQALALAVPVAIFVDAYRFQLPSRVQREAWGLNVAATSFALALELAREVGDATLIAELILDARTAGTHTLTGVSTEDDDGKDGDRFLPVVLLAASSENGSGNTPEFGGGDLDGDAWVASSAAMRTIGADGYRLAPTPYIRTMRSTIALEEHIRVAQQRYSPATPLRRPIIIEP